MFHGKVAALTVPFLRALRSIFVGSIQVLPLEALTEDTTPDILLDFLYEFDASTGLPKKVKPRNLGFITTLLKSGVITGPFSTTVETALFSVSVPQNSMGANGAVRATISGLFVNNSGAGRTVRFRIKFGATTIYDDISASFATSANPRPFILTFTVQNLNLVNSQRGFGRFVIGNIAAVTTGYGDLATAPQQDAVIASLIGGCSEDTSAAAKTFTITAELSVADCSMESDSAIVELI